ncbi:MAG: type IV secretion system protein VirB10 [Caulobacteraceae bacterium]
MSDLTGDPRRGGPRETDDDLALASLESRPAVARGPTALPIAVVALALTVAGVGVFVAMSAQRVAKEEPAITTPLAAGPQIAAAPPLLDLPGEPRTTGPLYQIPGPQFTTSNAVPLPPLSPAPAAPGAGAAPNPADPAQRRRAPALVVDLGSGENPSAGIPNPSLVSVPKPGTPLDPKAAEAAANQLSSEERFAERIGTGDSEKVRATMMRNLDAVIPQGAIIPAVLETAINSDLPGYTRAVVSRDVKSFDGTAVLIPRGSRLIGQYKSGVALGASRIFVIWSRVIRPDGVTIQIGSPGTDTLGQGGLEGKVDRRFFQRFGGSILLSVVNAGLNALANSNRSGSQIYIGSSTDATNVAGIALQKDGGTPPTIRTPQGAPVSIFVARDLDFTGMVKVK